MADPFYNALSVGLAALQVPITPGTSVLISRPADGTAGIVYIGTDAAVTTATGTPVRPGYAVGLSGRSSGTGPATGVWLISDTAATDVRYLAGTY